jgi:hypothetical protein
LYLSNSVVFDNAADYGAGLFAYPGSTGFVVDQSYIENNRAQYLGGGIYSAADTQLSHTTISNNEAAGDSGGGLYYAAGSPATLTDLTILSNTVDSPVSAGGGIGLSAAPINLVNSTVGWNHAGFCGGGIGSTGAAVVQVRNSTLEYNQAQYGGGVCDGGGFTTAIITLTDSTVYGNQAVLNGGGLFVNWAGLYNDTVSQNVADSHNGGSGDGGGVFIAGTGVLNLANSILAGNIDNGGQPPECSGSGGINSLGYNLIQGGNACPIAGDTAHDLPSSNPLLGALADNGGPTWTQALPRTSPAVNAGNPAGCLDSTGALLSTDQRGLPRWLRCDIGAFELQPLLLFLPLVRR